MSWTLAELAEICAGAVKGDPSHKIDGFAPAEASGPGKLSFVTGDKWLAKLSKGAAAVIPPFLEEAAGNMPAIIADQPRLAFARILDKVMAADRPEPGVHPTAVIEEGAEVDSSAHVGAMAYIGPRAQIGPGSIVHPQAHIAAGAVVAADCVIHPHCYIGPGSKIGNRVILGPGVVIGYDGFGYHWDGSKHVRVPQVGITVLEDDVEIGALSAIDRATLGETVIKSGTKIDNLVMVGHNCRIGPNAILVAQVGLSGSAIVEEGAVLAGQAGVREGTRIGAGVIVAGQAGVAKDVPPGARVGGTPARNESTWMRGQVLMAKLPELFRRVKRIENKIEAPEGKKHKNGRQSGKKGDQG